MSNNEQKLSRKVGDPVEFIYSGKAIEGAWISSLDTKSLSVESLNKFKYESALSALSSERKSKQDLVEEYQDEISAFEATKKHLIDHQKKAKTANTLSDLHHALYEVGIKPSMLRSSILRNRKQYEADERQALISCEATKTLFVHGGPVIYGNSVAEFIAPHGYINIDTDKLKTLCSAIARNHLSHETPTVSNIKGEHIDSKSIAITRKFLGQPVPQSVFETYGETLYGHVQDARSKELSALISYQSMLEPVDALSDSISQKRAVLAMVHSSGSALSDRLKNKLIAKLNRSIQKDSKKHDVLNKKASKFRTSKGLDRHFENAEQYAGYLDAQERLNTPRFGTLTDHDNAVREGRISEDRAYTTGTPNKQQMQEDTQLTMQIWAREVGATVKNLGLSENMLGESAVEAKNTQTPSFQEQISQLNANDQEFLANTKTTNTITRDNIEAR